MSLLANIIGFSAFGFGARCFQLGIQKRNIFSHPEGHIAAAAIFGTFGYFLYYTEQRQNEQIAHKRKVLEANRAGEAVSA
ncbi:hypothetical protein CspeluHIS016_0301620 [Cutaneotrichosporon spelunceum]|uniref:Uncharacterized protein n=1 Tax=Cutaneotrichosporon spelunceum TaxID=1672016 RepID=A0AAD3TTN0_9TREE|nr:hypothetical protein CspeluHIS016_0301620 [Cutaneotrichosporon spelunceum]